MAKQQLNVHLPKGSSLATRSYAPKISVGSSMAIALVSHTAKAATSSGSGSGFTTSAIDTSGATLLVALVSWVVQAHGATLTDSKGNTWTPLTQRSSGNFTNLILYYAANPTVGTGHTFTLTAADGSTDGLGLNIATFSGTATVSPFDVQNGNTGAPASTFQGGSVTPSNANSLVIAAGNVQRGQSDITSINSGFTITDTLSNSSFNGGASLAYLVETAIAAQNPTWTKSNGLGWWSEENAVFIVASVVTNIAIPVGSLATTTYAPGVTVAIPVGVASLATTTYAPGVTAGVSVPAGSLAITSYAPTLTASIPISVGALVTTTYVPGVTQNTTIFEIPVGSLVTATFAPGVTIAIQIPAGSLGFTTYAPARGIPVPAASLSLAEFTPRPNVPVPAASIVLTEYAPFLSQQNIHIPAATLTLTKYAPAPGLIASISVPVRALHFTTFAPAVSHVVINACAERFGPKLYYWEPSYLLRPEDTFLRATDWENAGHQGMKFVQGIIIEADTEGETRQIKLQGDQADIETITINHNGQIMKPYSLNQPVQKHLLRLLPVDLTAHWRLFNFRWVYEPAPEYAKEWKTQGTDHDIPGYQFLKDGYIAHASTADITLNITVDDNVFTYVIPNSGGVYVKTYILFAIANSGLSLKGSLFTYELTSAAPFQLFQKDCEVRVHAWAGGAYMVKLPFGDVHRTAGARI